MEASQTDPAATATPAIAPTTATTSSSSRTGPPLWIQWKTMDDSSKLQTNQLLLETSARVQDAFVELCSLSDALDAQLTALQNTTDDIITRQDLLQSVSAIRHTLRSLHHPLLPMVHVASTTIQTAALTLAPMGSTMALHERNEAARKKEANKSGRCCGGTAAYLMEEFLGRSRVDWRSAVRERCAAVTDTTLEEDAAWKEGSREEDDARSNHEHESVEALAIADVVDHLGTAREDANEEQDPLPPLPAIDDNDAAAENDNSQMTDYYSTKRSPSVTHTSSQPLKKRKISSTSSNSKTTKSKRTPSNEITLPPPARGTQYTKPEAVSIAQSYPRDSTARGSVMSAMISKGYVPSSRRTIQRLVKLAEEGKIVPNTPWTGRNGGAPPLLGNEDIDAIVHRVMEKDARIHGKEDIVEMLVHAARAKMQQKGMDVNLAKTEFSASVVHNYMTIFKSKLPAKYWV